MERAMKKLWLGLFFALSACALNACAGGAVFDGAPFDLPAGQGTAVVGVALPVLVENAEFTGDLDLGVAPISYPCGEVLVHLTGEIGICSTFRSCPPGSPAFRRVNLRPGEYAITYLRRGDRLYRFAPDLRYVRSFRWETYQEEVCEEHRYRERDGTQKIVKRCWWETRNRRVANGVAPIVGPANPMLPKFRVMANEVVHIGDLAFGWDAVNGRLQVGTLDFTAEIVALMDKAALPPPRRAFRRWNAAQPIGLFPCRYRDDGVATEVPCL